MNCNDVTILLADGDRGARIALADQLAADGYAVLEADSVPGATRMLAHGGVDLAIIDRGLPGGDALELLRHVRGAQGGGSRLDSELLLMVTSGRNTGADRLLGYEQGCDDYVAAPCAYTELRARIGALLRRRLRGPVQRRVRVGPLEIDALARQAWLGADQLRLSNKEFGLLWALASDPQRVFSRAELLRVVWGWHGESVAEARTRTLDSHASRLRRKLAAGGTGFVVNVWGVGYRLVDGVPHAG